MKKTKKMVAVALIVALASLMSSEAFRITLADTQGGICRPYQDAGQDPKGDCYYSMCHHLNPYPAGGTYDAWISTASAAYYDLDEPYPEYPDYECGFGQCRWEHVAATGGYFEMRGPLNCMCCVDGDNIHYVYEYDDPEWDYIYPWYAWYRVFNFTSDDNLDPRLESVEGWSMQVYNDPPNWPAYYWITSYTDPDYVTAWYNTTGL
jgi:hypothetical protein